MGFRQKIDQALLERGVSAARIALAGESAGAGLAVATLVALEYAGLPQPSAAVLLSPWVDLTLSGPSLTGTADLDPARLPSPSARVPSPRSES